MPKLHQRLALSAYVGSLLGDERDTLGAALREVQEGTAPSGQSNFYESIRGRRGLRLEDGALQRYDTNILAHEGTLQRHRPGFRLRYFQYLAVLYTEILLDRLATDPGALLRDVEAYRAEHFDDLPEIHGGRPADARLLDGHGRRQDAAHARQPASGAALFPKSLPQCIAARTQRDAPQPAPRRVGREWYRRRVCARSRRHSGEGAGVGDQQALRRR